MDKYKDLEPKVLDWAEERDLLEDNLLGQANRVLRDTEALHLACRMKSQGRKEFISGASKIVKTEDEVKSTLGKLMFDLIILAEINGVSLEDCLNETYKNKNK